MSDKPITEDVVDFLRKNTIKHVYGDNGESYIAYNDNGVFFDITFHENINKYMIRPYGHFAGTDPNFIFDAMSYAFRVQELAKIGKKNINRLYTESMVDSDVFFEKRKDFETYITEYKEVTGYAIGYNPKTQQYGFKRYCLINNAYEFGNIPLDQKPDYAKLYTKTKQLYEAQMAIQSMRSF